MTSAGFLDGQSIDPVAFSILWNIGNVDPDSLYFLFGAATYGPTADSGQALQLITAGVTNTGPAITGTIEPNWPTGDSAIFSDGTVVWQENTPVIANTVPPPPAPTLALAGGGTFAAGLDVYVILTLVNPKGETLASSSGMITTVAASSSVTFPALTLAGLPSWVQQLPNTYLPTVFKVYVASVAHGAEAPAQGTYQLFGATIPLGAGTATVTGPGTGAVPPLITTARITPAGLASPDSAPPLTRLTGTGAFPAGRDVYVVATALDSQGETTPSPAGIISDTVASDAVQVSIPGTQYQVTGINIYEADVLTGAAPPPNEAYALVGTFQPNTTPTITTTAAGRTAAEREHRRTGRQHRAEPAGHATLRVFRVRE